ncbi:MAG: hypothetical protein JWM64_1500 [Frankiales bacterium]|nr:hypothetical protein [Frankiales bacterium]
MRQDPQGPGSPGTRQTTIGAAVRWKGLFDDLEAQAEALAKGELEAEVRDRIRRENALLRLSDRLASSIGATVQLQVAGAGVLHGVLLDTGVDWLLLEETGGREVLVPALALLGVAGVGRRTQAPGAEGEVGKRLDLRWALRGLARDRAGVAVVLRDGTTVGGTLDRVASDFVELAEHGTGEARRDGAVLGVRLLPLEGLALVRRV